MKVWRGRGSGVEEVNGVKRGTSVNTFNNKDKFFKKKFIKHVGLKEVTES